MKRKAEDWSKEKSKPPSPGYFSEEWVVWQDVIMEQIQKSNPGAFQSWEARNEYVSWMNQLGPSTMLYLRYLSYEGTYPVTIIYAETGTMPRTIQYPLPPPPARMEPPPPYPHSAQPTQTTFQLSPLSTSLPGSYPSTSDTSGSSTYLSGSTVTSVSSVPSSAASTPMPQFVRPVTLIGNHAPSSSYGEQSQEIRSFAAPRPSQIHSLHSQSHSRQLSQVRSPLIQTTHAAPSHQSWNSQSASSQFFRDQHQNAITQQHLQQQLQQQQQEQQHHAAHQSYSAPAAMSQLQQGLAQMTISSQNGPRAIPSPFPSAPVVPMQLPVNPPLGFHQKRASIMSEGPTTRPPPVVPPQPPVIPYQIPGSEPPSRRVSFANHVQHQAGSSQYQIPLSPASSLAQPQTQLSMSPPAPMNAARPIDYPFAPYVPGPQPGQTAAPGSSSNAMLQYLAQLRGARLPPHHGSTPNTLPETYPPGRPADDDWETMSNFSTESRATAGLSYQGQPQTNPMYAAFQAAHAQGHVPSGSTAHTARSFYNPHARM